MPIFKPAGLNNNLIMNLSVEQVAELFCGMDDTEQAQFFNHVSEIASTWELGGGMVMQLQYVTDNELTLGGRRVMQMIGEYSHWGLVPKAKELPELLTTKEEDAKWDLNLGGFH